jgi:hypothetical protein
LGYKNTASGWILGTEVEDDNQEQEEDDEDEPATGLADVAIYRLGQ